MTDVVSLQRYESALRDHLRRGGEEQMLLHAYELGRELMDGGAGVLDVARLHADALAEVEHHAGADPRVRRSADGFLAEVLAPFEMAFLGFKEANTALRRLTASLEEQVDQRTRELQESLSALQSADAERRRLTARVVSAQEQERHRIADDLHDDVVQVMTAVALRVSTLGSRIKAEDKPLFDRLEGTVSDSIARLRRLIFELRPPALDREGLAAAIRVYLSTALADGPDCTVEDRLHEDPPLEEREIAYRVTQEALANVRKHAKARQVAVTLEPHDEGVRITVVDDGTGFDPRELDMPRPGHLGTTAMRERAALAGGWCTIDSAPGAGTTVRLWIPHRDRGSRQLP